MCSFFEISRSCYYAWVKRELESGKGLQLGDLIVECQRRNKRLYGCRRVRIWLFREYGIVVNHKRILRVMNNYGLLSVIRRKGYYWKHRSWLMNISTMTITNAFKTKPV